MLRICQSCGKTFEGLSTALKCPECASKAKSSTIRERTCRQCGVKFPGGPRAWYCPDCRAVRAKKQWLEYRNRRKNGTVRKIGSTDFCVICGREYRVASSSQRYCHDCAQAAVQEIDRAQALAWAAENTTPEMRRERRKAAAAEIPCAICGKLFVPSGPSITCSPECSSELSRRNQSKYESNHRKERNAYHRAQRKKREAAMTPEELEQHRQAVRDKARENRKKRKERQQGQS